MIRYSASLLVLPALLAASSLHAQKGDTLPPPAAVVAEGVPAVPAELVARTRPYLESRAAVLEGWNPKTKAALILTDFGNTRQMHEVAMPGGARRQLSFEADKIAEGSYAPAAGDALVVQKDVGGDEFWQLYALASGRLTLLTDGKSRNEFGAWSRDGTWIAYSSTRRNGTDSDLYVVNPRNPKSDRMVAKVQGGGWSVTGFTPDGTSALVKHRLSVAKSDLFLMDIETGAMRPLGDHRKAVSYEDARFARDGVLWATSDEGSDFQRLGTIDPKNGAFTAVPGQTKWDVELFGLSEGDWIAFATNEAGASRLKILDTRSGTIRTVPDLPTGLISTLKVAPWGEIGVTLASARSATDVFSVDPKTLKVTRWTESETGGLDPAANVEPELVEVKSFDGETVSGFLYRPDPKRFPGKRPLIIDIHGGPESQTRPGFLGRANYYPNELGVALFYPNVRGSSGFGKRFVNLDNGPFKREDSVKDIGAFLDRLAADPQIDAARIGETGGSYGGYMCYATAIRYGARLKGAICQRAISNFVSFLENTQSYRRDLRRVEYGDERDPRQRAKLMAVSPLTSVAALKIPVVIVTGANDPRVPPSESDQMVAAIRKNGAPVWSILAKDEGHGYVKRENIDYQFRASLLFWQQVLLGPEPK